MKFSWVILIIPLSMTSIITARSIEETEQTIQSCKPGDWLLTNITIKENDDMINLTVNVNYHENSNCTIYTAQINLAECKNHTECTGKPEIKYDKIDCKSNNLTEDQTNNTMPNGYQLDQEMNNWEKIWMEVCQKLGENFDLKCCINDDNYQLTINGDNTNKDDMGDNLPQK